MRCRKQASERPSKPIPELMHARTANTDFDLLADQTLIHKFMLFDDSLFIIAKYKPMFSFILCVFLMVSSHIA